MASRSDEELQTLPAEDVQRASAWPWSVANHFTEHPEAAHFPWFPEFTYSVLIRRMAEVEERIAQCKKEATLGHGPDESERSTSADNPESSRGTMVAENSEQQNRADDVFSVVAAYRK